MAEVRAPSSEEEDMPVPPPRAPRWVKVFAVIGLVLLALLVVAFLVRGGQHGPGRHALSVQPSGPALCAVPSVSTPA